MAKSTKNKTDEPLENNYGKRQISCVKISMRRNINMSYWG